MNVLIVEGIDHVGKTTFINNFRKEYQNSIVIHSSKPLTKNNPEQFQQNYFLTGFNLINSVLQNDNNDWLIFDRFHLGECVYGPLYRNSKFENGLQYEILLNNLNLNSHLILVLLKCNTLDIRCSDSFAFDDSYAAAQKEQNLFLKAFELSKIEKKYIIDVDYNKEWKSDKQILKEFKLKLNS
jgi:thymidylate kinase